MLQHDLGIFTRIPADPQIVSPWSLKDALHADTVIVPGLNDIDRIPTAVCDAISEAARRGARIVSICSGSFILAAARLLVGRKATTHWAAAGALAARHPETLVLPNVLYIGDENIYTSGGATAGLDLCLHLIQSDYGSSAAAEAARLALVPLVRDGGQAQFVKPSHNVGMGSLAPLLQWAATQKNGSLGISDLAQHAGLSMRTLTRRFQDQLGTSPQKFLISLSIEKAKTLLESTRLPIDFVSDECGFNSVVTFRTAFTRVVGVAPSRYRKAFCAD